MSQGNIGKKIKNRSEEIKLRIFVVFLFLACVFLISVAHVLKSQHKNEVRLKIPRLTPCMLLNSALCMETSMGGTEY